MSEYKIVGIIILDDGDLVDIVSADNGFGIKDSFYNNDPFGIIGFSGFENHEFESIEKYIVEDSKWSVSTEYESMCELIRSGIRGKCKGALFFKDGILLIQDTVFFEGVFQKRQQDDTYIEEKYTEFVDVFDIENVIDEELFSALGLLV